MSTVEEEVANLTTSVDQLTDAVNVKKATLDASVADSETARDQSQGYRDEARTARDEAQSHANTAAAEAQDALSAVSYQDLTAIAESKSETAVDVFVYDTSLDSDGGAWRHRCQHTSWYNETLNTATRGSRKEFPSVAVIVAETTTITIYDGDDPDLPMWMVFNASSTDYLIGGAGVSGSKITSVSSANARVSVGADYDLHVIDFAGDRGARAGAGPVWGPFKGNIEQRNDSRGWSNSTASFLSNGPIVNRAVNDVAMTVLPDAPVDPATGLPVPTIAVGTEGGLSIIHNDGSVVDVGPTGGAGAKVSSVSFDVNHALHVCRGYEGNGRYGWITVFDPLPASDTTDPGDDQDTSPPANVFNVYSDVALAPSQHRAAWMGNSSSSHHGDETAWRMRTTEDRFGVSRLLRNPANLSGGSLVAYQAHDYCTGWMAPATKGAFLSDTDDTDLVGSELNTDPNFDSGVGIFIAANGTVTHSSGTITSTKNSVGISAMTSSAVLTVGKSYYIEFEITDTSPDYTHINSPIGEITSGQVGTHSGTFIAGSTTVNFGQNNGGTTSSVTFTRISIRPADADRSVNNNGLIVNGTVTREPVAPGADLVAYSGFSSTNYLEQPYNPDLDFGTGDFCVMGWVKPTDAGSYAFLDRGDTSGGGFSLEMLASGEFLARFDGNSYFYTNVDGPITPGVWQHLVMRRRGDQLKFFHNSEPDRTYYAATRDVTQVGANLVIGKRWDDSRPFDGSLALVRISATAPTAEQIKRIYEDEKVLFQPGAQATLYGTSDGVTALAHDPVTDLLHVGSSDGRSVFQGLRRVENTTIPVNTAISAVGGMIAED